MSWTEICLKYVAEVLQAESLVFKDLIGVSSFFCCLTCKKCFMLLNTTCWIHSVATLNPKRKTSCFPQFYIVGLNMFYLMQLC